MNKFSNSRLFNIEKNSSVDFTPSVFDLYYTYDKTIVSSVTEYGIDERCVDVFSAKLFSTMDCELPASCYGVNKILLGGTWYGSKVWFCYGFSKEIFFINNDHKFMSYPGNYYTFLNYLMSKWFIVGMEPSKYWGHYVQIVNGTHTFYRYLPLGFVKSLSDERDLKKFISVDVNWVQVTVKIYRASLVYRIVTSRKHDVNLDTKILLIVSLNSTYKFVFRCADKIIIDSFINSFKSDLCTDYVPYNYTHMIRSWIISDYFTAQDICPVYYIPIPNDDRLYDSYKFNIRTNTRSFVESIFYSLELGLLSAFKVLLDPIFELILRLLDELLVWVV